MKVHVAQIGARRHYAVPIALARRGMLDGVSTDWCANRGLLKLVDSAVPRALKRGPLARLRDRQIADIPSKQVTTFLGHTFRMGIKRRFGRRLDSYVYWATANQDFGNGVVRTGFGTADTVYGFNAAAVEIFRAARNRGLRTVLDQTMAPWRYVETLLAEERDRWPDWESKHSGGDWRLLADREAEEWDLADAVICGSPFVVDALQECGGDTERCHVVPYGYDAAPTGDAVRRTSHGRLRVLFVGTLELRKGVPCLLEAVRQFRREDIEVRMVGPIRIQPQAVEKLKKYVDIVGPVPRSAVRQHYHWADVFVLPTLAEGSANVCYEAMSHGLPVITTPNAGSVVRDAVDGYLVEPRDADALVDRLNRIIEDRRQLEAMSVSAMQRSQEFSWAQYYERLPSTICAAFQEAPKRESQAIEVS